MSATLRDLQRIVRVVGGERPALAGRLERAALLLLFRHILVLGEGRYQIESEDGRQWYHVGHGRCTCADFKRHGLGYLCKHLLAIAIAEELGLLLDGAEAEE